ncbi:MAG: hypothetical protein AAF694_18435 [Bacteroidota bacterium]
MNYQSFCVAQKVVPSIGNFVDYLLAYNFLTSSTVRHFVVLQEFEDRLKGEKFSNKTQIIDELAASIGIHPNSVWNILKDHKHKFSPNS